MSDGITAGQHAADEYDKEALRFLSIARALILILKKGKIPEETSEILDGLNRFHRISQGTASEIDYPELSGVELDFVEKLVNKDEGAWGNLFMRYPYSGELKSPSKLYGALKDLSPFAGQEIFFVSRFTNGDVRVEIEPSTHADIKLSLSGHEPGKHMVVKRHTGKFEAIQTE